VTSRDDVISVRDEGVETPPFSRRGVMTSYTGSSDDVVLVVAGGGGGGVSIRGGVPTWNRARDGICS